jgi:hypothetical protein
MAGGESIAKKSEHRSSGPGVAMVKASDTRQRDDATGARRLDGPLNRCVAVQAMCGRSSL